MMKRIEVHVPNEAGVLGARRGVWNGCMSVFTHRNPKNGKIWGENIPVPHYRARTEYGKWVSYEEVKFV